MQEEFTPLLKETNFSLWLHPSGVPRAPEGMQATLFRTMYIISLVHLLQMNIPEWAGKYRPDRISEMEAAIRNAGEGGLFVSHHLGISVLSYGQAQGMMRLMVKIVCLDPSMPITVEFDVPVVGDAADDWADEVSFSVVAPVDQDPLDHPLMFAIASLFECLPADLEEEIDAEAGCATNAWSLLQDYLYTEPERMALVLRQGILNERKCSEAKVKAAGDQSRRDLRRLNRQAERLQQQLDTARAVADRQRSRADKAERQAKSALASTEGTSTKGTPASAPESVPRSELEAVQDQNQALQMQLDQIRGEMDGLKEQLHQANRRNQLLQEASSQERVDASVPDIPTTFDALQSWIESQLDAGRILVHPKAIRAARKSVFRDPGQVYRTLKAFNDWYWPMKIKGDAVAGRQWEAFLDQERLRCSPTGAAVENGHTRESYLISYRRSRYPLDMHLQGSSSRKEEDAFRLYFHASHELGKVLIGHFPTHLPNRHT